MNFHADRKPSGRFGDLRNLPNQLASLVAQRRWVVWKWKNKKHKWTKEPFKTSTPDVHARSNDPTTWGDHAGALAVAETGRADGVGFMLSNSEFAAFDLDDCRDPDTGAVEEWALQLVEKAASYTEVTVSGTGLRIIGHAKGNHVHRKQRYPGADGTVETYRRAARFIVITGSDLAEPRYRPPGNNPGSCQLADTDRIIDETVARLDQSKAKRMFDEVSSKGPPTNLEELNSRRRPGR